MERLAEDVCHVNSAGDGAREVTHCKHQKNGYHHPRKAHLSLLVWLIRQTALLQFGDRVRTAVSLRGIQTAVAVAEVVIIVVIVVVIVVVTLTVGASAVLEPQAGGPCSDVDAGVEVDDETARNSSPDDQQEYFEFLAGVVKIKIAAGQSWDEVEVTPDPKHGWLQESDWYEPGYYQHESQVPASENHVIHLAIYNQFVAVPSDCSDSHYCCTSECIPQEANSTADVDVELPAIDQVSVHVDRQDQGDKQHVAQTQVSHEQVGCCLELLGLRHSQDDENISQRSAHYDDSH